jgi:TolA-binding protein
MRLGTSSTVILNLLPLALLAGCDPAEVPPAATPTVEIARASSSVEVAAPAPKAPAAVAVTPKEPGALSLRDERRQVAKSRALLTVEVQSLESLFGATTTSSPDRPKLLRRLAESYVELAAASERESGGEKTAAQARAGAMKHYRRLASEYPRWCIGNAVDPTKATGCADEALYYLGLEAERARDLDAARKTYLELIQTWPSSHFIPHAYLAFGELFFADAASDPSKLSLAEQSYIQVIKYPPPDNGLYGFANYRLAQVYARKGDHARALSNFVKAAEHAKTYGDRGKIGAAALHEAVVAYARAGDPAQARAFFGRLTSNPEELETLLSELATIAGAP